MNNKKNILPIIAVLIFTAALVSFIVYFVSNKDSDDTDKSTQDITPTTVVENTVESTPTPMVTLAEVDKDIKIQVLNATDINGQAATIKSKLVGLGFENVTVGNASANATENSVQAKTKDTASYFETSLGDFFAGEYTSDLKSSSTYDVVFTIGTDLSKSSSSVKTTVTPTKASTITPTKTATATPTKKATATPTEAE